MMYIQNTSDKKVCVVGVGYVGEHLVRTFAKKYSVHGFDVSQPRVEFLKQIFHDHSNMEFSSNENILENAHLYCISVPTLLKSDNSVDDSYLKKACETVSKYAKSGSTVVMESSVYVGMTRKLLASFREKGVYVGFSPERVDPGRTKPSVDQIPKIISGFDEESSEKIKDFYASVFDMVVPVSSMETAEMCKLFENCYRMINIAYVNEISDACVKQGIDPTEMINACATKPFGFQKFNHSLGVGGYCIPINPYYLFVNNDLPLLKQATEYSKQRPKEKANKLCREKPLKNVLVVGIAFKPGQKVLANSPAMAFVEQLQQNNISVKLYDPMVDNVKGFDMITEKEWNTEYLQKHFDTVVIAMKQFGVDFSLVDSLPQDMVIYPEIL